jgi:hypothetical protein
MNAIYNPLINAWVFELGNINLPPKAWFLDSIKEPILGIFVLPTINTRAF